MRKSAFFGLLLISLVCNADEGFNSREIRYRLHPGDTLGISYRYSPEYDATVKVQPDGHVTLPLLGDLKIGGLTVEETHSKLVGTASQRLNDPEIIVDLKTFEQPSFIVGGEVGSPGRFEIHGRMTALRAVQLAGGFKGSSKASKVLLIRPVNDVDAQTKLLDLTKVAQGRDLQEDVELRAGDMLIVPKNPIAKVEPYVKLLNLGMYFNPLGF